MGLFAFVTFIIALTVILRFCGAPRWVAVGVPTAPPLAAFVYFVIRHIRLGPQENGVPTWVYLGILLVLVAGCSITADIAIKGKVRSRRRIRRRSTLSMEPEPTRRNPPAKLPPIRE